MIKDLNDTIIAQMTPVGPGAIGVIRLSGPRSVSVVNRFFSGVDLEKVDGNTVHLGKIKDDKGKVLDECLVTVFRAPKSYTKEDIIEISCHGSPYILEEVQKLFIRNGIRLADRGEFTLRAFLNGQMDLTQAEAVADLIASDCEASHELALKQMRGGFSEEIKRLREELIEFASLIELELDFGEEDVAFADKEKLLLLIRKIQAVVRQLVHSFELGNVLKNGVNTVIAGRPNAGKSTLLNAMLNDDRAIVSDIEGTTRDTIEEVLNIKGVQFRLVDTAGLRSAQDEIERIGIERTQKKISESTIILYVFDIVRTKPEELWADVEEFFGKDDQLNSEASILFIGNKMDMNPYSKPQDFYKEGMISKENLITASARNNMNIEYIKDSLYNIVIEDPEMMNQTLVSNTRHYAALTNSLSALESAENALVGELSGDLIAFDLRQSLHHLGEITGEISSEDLLDSIFSNFCIGK